MTLLDTDTLTLYFAGHGPVVGRVEAAEEVPAITVVSRIEVLQGRFESLIKAADGDQLLRAQQRLAWAEENLAQFTIVAFTASAVSTFDQLRGQKRLKKMGRADLLIACISLANRATLVSRNLRHFR